MRTFAILIALSASLYTQAQTGVGRIIPDVPPYPGDTLKRCTDTWGNMKSRMGLETLKQWGPDIITAFGGSSDTAYMNVLALITNEDRGFLADTTDGHGPANIMTIYKYTEYHANAREMPGYVWFPVDSLDKPGNTHLTIQVMNYHFSPYNPDYKKYKNLDEFIISWNTGTEGMKKKKRAAGFLGRHKAYLKTHLFMSESGLAHAI